MLSQLLCDFLDVLPFRCFIFNDVCNPLFTQNRRIRYGTN